MLKDDLDWVVGICFGEIAPAEIVKLRMNCTELPYLFGVLGRVEVGLRRIKQVTNIMLDPLEVSEGELTFFSCSSEFTDFSGLVLFESDEFGLVGCSQADDLVKMVQPVREFGYIFPDEELIYTIQFNNREINQANVVVIRDQINSHLDLSTFTQLDSSHPDNLSVIINNEEILFEFKEVFIPGIFDDTSSVDGFVSFLILPKEGLEEGTLIENTAEVQFDINSFQPTNTTLNTIVFNLPTDMDGDGFDSIQDCDDTNPDIYLGAMEIINKGVDEDCNGLDSMTVSTAFISDEYDISISPNPANGIAKIDSNENFGTVKIIEVTGKTISIFESSANQLYIDLSEYLDSIYF